MPSARQRADIGAQCGDKQYADHSEHRADGDLLADADELHPDKHDACADNVEQQHAPDVRQAEPAAEHRRCACQKCADVHNDRHAEQRESQPGKNLLDASGEQLRVEAAHELRAVIVVRKLRNYEMQHDVYEVAQRDYPENFAQAVVRREVRHREYPRADAVADNDAGRLKEAETGFALDLTHIFKTHFLCFICIKSFGKSLPASAIMRKVNIVSVTFPLRMTAQGSFTAAPPVAASLRRRTRLFVTTRRT